ncbi:MAG: GerMN domain-containing protein [Pelovirga sp.]
MKKVVFGLALVLVVGILLGYGVGWFFQQERDEESLMPEFVEEALPPREVTLYFSEPEGRYLERVTTSIDGCDDDRDCVRALLERLIAGPTDEMVRVIPETTEIKGVELENDLVRINFSRHLVDHHPGGSLTELLTIHSLTNSLSESFPYLRQLQILVEGDMRQTLKGHVRIDHPVYADYTLAEPPRTGTETDTLQPQDQEGGLEIEHIIEEAAGSSN